MGAVLSKTGSESFTGLENLQAITLAISEINAAGGVLGKQLKLTDVDDASTAAQAKAGAQTLADQGVPVIFGGVASAFSLEIATVANAAKITQLSASSTSVKLSVKDDFFFRTCGSDAVQSKTLAKRARSRTPALSKVAVIYIDDGAYGPGLADDFEAEFVRLGGTITGKEPYTPERSSYADVLSNVFMGNPDGVMLVAYPTEGAQIIKDYLQAYPGRSTVWLFTDGVVDPTFIAGVGASEFTFPHEGTASSNAVGPRYDAFKAAFKARYAVDPAPGSFSANAYDGVYLVALAMTAAGASTGEAVKAHLPAVSAGGTVFIAGQYQEAVAALKAGTDINFEGTSGNVDFDDFGNVSSAFDSWRVENGAVSVFASNPP